LGFSRNSKKQKMSQWVAWLSGHWNRRMRTGVAALALFTCVLIAFGTQADQLKDADAALARKDYETAIAILSELADAGNAEASLKLGSMYLYGNGVVQDVEKGERLLRVAADAGDSEARYRLGLCHVTQRLCPQDLGEARRWLELAAMQGYSPAQLDLAQLGWMLGDTDDRISALKWVLIVLKQPPESIDMVRIERARSLRDRFMQELSSDQIEAARSAAAQFAVRPTK